MAESTYATTQAEVLEANATFYRAFTEGDYDTMSALWAERAPVTCFHPGARALIGRSAVLDTWRQILGGALRLTAACS
jgi:hypothetical protein